ncbi:MAG: hypothetical protein OXU67_08980 [Chloroflexota bacterium]|nr:hypothetical protein [Chloroflexota bacterium]
MTTKTRQQPAPADSVEPHLALATPERVARAIFAAVKLPDPLKRWRAKRRPQSA